MTDRLANAQERAIKMLDTTFVMCYQEGFDDGYRDGQDIEQSNAVTTKEEVAKIEYERGLNDAWECARKIVVPIADGGLSYESLFQMFEHRSTAEILREFSASEIIAKIKEYEEKKETQKIKVGDIVTVGEDDAEEFIVTFVSDEHLNKVTLISRSGFHARTTHKDCLTKTGEHCDIEKCFKYNVF